MCDRADPPPPVPFPSLSPIEFSFCILSHLLFFLFLFRAALRRDGWAPIPPQPNACAVLCPSHTEGPGQKKGDYETGGEGGTRVNTHPMFCFVCFN